MKLIEMDEEPAWARAAQRPRSGERAKTHLQKHAWAHGARQSRSANENAKILASHFGDGLLYLADSFSDSRTLLIVVRHHETFSQDLVSKQRRAR